MMTYSVVTMFDKEIYKSLRLDDNHCNIPRSKSDSEYLQYQPRSSKVQSFIKFLGMFDLPNTDTAHDSPISFANQLKTSLHLNQSRTFQQKHSNQIGSTTTTEKHYCIFIPSPSSTD